MRARDIDRVVESICGEVRRELGVEVDPLVLTRMIRQSSPSGGVHIRPLDDPTGFATAAQCLQERRGECTVTEAAQLAVVTRQTISYAIDAGRIAARSVGGNASGGTRPSLRLVSVASLADYIESRKKVKKRRALGPRARGRRPPSCLRGG